MRVFAITIRPMIAGPASNTQVSLSLGSMPDQISTPKNTPSHRQDFPFIDLVCCICSIPFTVKHGSDQCISNQIPVGNKQ